MIKNSSFILLLISISLLFSQCMEEWTVTKYHYKNETNHEISLISCRIDLTKIDSIQILPGKSLDYSFEYEGKSNPYLFLMYEKYYFISYDDSILILHGDLANPVNRNILQLESYSGGLIDEGRNYNSFEYGYIFTEADYQEALERHLQNKKVNIK